MTMSASFTNDIAAPRDAGAPASLSAEKLLPPGAYCGIGGCVRLGQGPTPYADSGEATAPPGTTVWRRDSYSIWARGEAHHATSATGWEVFALAKSPIASLVAKILDQTSPAEPDAGPALTGGMASELCWGLLPAAAVVAIHAPSGQACLLRDGLGFRPLYYSWREERLAFSSNLAALRSCTAAASVQVDKISEMLLFGNRSGSRTLWGALEVVVPGQLACFSPGREPRFQWFWQPRHLFDESERQRLDRLSKRALLAEIGAAFEEALATIRRLPHVVVPCGGGVDSSLLGAYLRTGGQQVTFRCINQPEAPLREADWTEPLSRKLGIPCAYTQLTREVFLRNLIDSHWRSGRTVAGPNFAGGYALRVQGREEGEREFIYGQFCDTLFGGLSTFTYLAPRFQLLRRLSRLPRRLRLWLWRALADESALLLGAMQIAHDQDAALIGAGDLGRAEMLGRVQSFSYPGQSAAQRLTDELTWLHLTVVASDDQASFYHADEWIGGTSHLPFAHPRLVRLGFHLPWSWKRRRGHNKWLWRVYAAPHIGADVAFRKKESFPILSFLWLNRAESLLPGGFLENLMRLPVSSLYARLQQHSTARWTLLNVELWGRLHCRGERPDALLEKIC